MPVSTHASDPLKLSAQIQGIGPTFKLTVSIQNTSLTTPSMGLAISFDYDDSLYQLQVWYKRRVFFSQQALNNTVLDTFSPGNLIWHRFYVYLV